MGHSGSSEVALGQAYLLRSRAEAHRYRGLLLCNAEELTTTMRTALSKGTCVLLQERLPEIEALRTVTATRSTRWFPADHLWRHHRQWSLALHQAKILELQTRVQWRFWGSDLGRSQSSVLRGKSIAFSISCSSHVLLRA